MNLLNVVSPTKHCGRLDLETKLTGRTCRSVLSLIINLSIGLGRGIHPPLCPVPGMYISFLTSKLYCGRLYMGRERGRERVVELSDLSTLYHFFQFLLNCFIIHNSSRVILCGSLCLGISSSWPWWQWVWVGGWTSSKFMRRSHWTRPWPSPKSGLSYKNWPNLLSPVRARWQVYPNMISYSQPEFRPLPFFPYSV